MSISDINSGGRPVHPFQEGIDNFRRWFDGSAVVDDSGRPLLMFHGTVFNEGGLGDISSFDRKFTATHLRRQQNLDMIGSWFSSRPDDAGAGKYADGPSGVIMPVYLRIRNPRTYRSFDELREEWCEENSSRHIPKTDRLAHKANKWYGSADSFVDLLTHEGNDGIRILPHSSRNSSEFAEQDVFLTFDPIQVKSALGNSGAFDPDACSILDQPLEMSYDAIARAQRASNFLFAALNPNATMRPPR